MGAERHDAGRGLFIVDNSVEGWTGLRYLEEWTGIARAFDIATGYFEIGGLLGLHGKWQGLEKIRILMGAEMTAPTRKALLDAVTARATAILDASLESEKEANPFLHGVKAIVEALKGGQIECRVYDRDKFHAKAYITHAKLEVVGSQALVGSSNFTRPGLTQNVELNIQVQSAREVAQLQEWFELYWAQAKPVTDAIIPTIQRHTHPYQPFDVYAKALQEMSRGHELTETEWEETRSRMFPLLDRYQKEGYWALLKIARQHRGAFLCDGVGLGKTFIGLMLIERLILHEGKRVVLFAPKGARDSVWEPHLRRFLPHIGGIGESPDFSNLAVFSHTDLGRKNDFPERFKRIATLADAVVIDEAHHFRNPGVRGSDEGTASRYYRLFDLLNPEHREKSLFLLTATPINNRLSDFRHMAELFTRRDESYFARTVGVNNLRAHFNNLEKDVSAQLTDQDGAAVAEHIVEAEQVLSADRLFQELVVQRSRAYARESQMLETGQATAFPERQPPIVADYSIKKTYGRLLEIVEKAFAKDRPLFTLPHYYPLYYYRGPDASIDPFDKGRQEQVVTLIRTQFLKRFESSVVAFEASCDRLMRKLLAFVQVNSQSEAQRDRLERWKYQHADVLDYALQRGLWADPDDDDDEDIVPSELLQVVPKLDRAEYAVDEMIAETYLDLDQVAAFLEEARRFQPSHDDKLQRLVRLLRSKEVDGQKVLIFTEFADTARYLLRELADAGVQGLAQVDSGTKEDRARIIKRFAPYYNGSSSPELAGQGLGEIRVLISTDVLSEGLNLQDATRLINYDIHWNPVRLMQRIGRVDRRMSPETEIRMVADHPETAGVRGKVYFWNFLPPDELNALLSLYRTVTRKTLLISKTLGIEGKKLLRPEDDFDALRDFNHVYEGTKSVSEQVHLEYQALIDADPGLEARLTALPGAIFSGRQREARCRRGVFFCYSLPALDRETGEFSEAAGTSRWYFVDDELAGVIEETGQIVGSVRSTPATPRTTTKPEKELLEARRVVEKHIKDTYMKRVNAPMGVKPVLKCWMEVNED